MHINIHCYHYTNAKLIDQRIITRGYREAGYLLPESKYA